MQFQASRDTLTGVSKFWYQKELFRLRSSEKKQTPRNISMKYESTGHRQFETVLFTHTGDDNNCDT